MSKINGVAAVGEQIAVQFNPNGAFVKKVVNVRLKQGLNEVVFDGVASDINAATTYINTGGAELISSTVEQSLKHRSATEKIKLELEKVKLENSAIARKIVAVDSEVDFLNANRNIEVGGDIAKLESYMAYYMSKVAVLAAQKSPLERALEEGKNQENALIKRMDATFTKKLSLILRVEEDIELAIAVGYSTALAGWAIEYDVFSEGIEEKIKVLLKANISNNSGEDFKDAQVMFCTFDTQNNGNVREFSPDYIPKDMLGARRYDATAMRAVQCESRRDGVASQYMSNTMTEDSENGKIYLYNESVTINDGTNSLMLKLESRTEDAEYSYECMSYADERVYLNIEFDTDLAINGRFASAYINGRYSGTSALSRNTKGKVSMNLGADEGVKVVREIIKNYDSKNILGVIKQQSGYTVKLLNTKSVPIAIKLIERIPVSTNKAITVNSEMNNNGKLNAENGRVDFALELKPDKEEIITVRYTVTSQK